MKLRQKSNQLKLIQQVYTAHNKGVLETHSVLWLNTPRILCSLWGITPPSRTIWSVLRICVQEAEVGPNEVI